jgi:CheY-like chemotaxis protein
LIIDDDPSHLKLYCWIIERAGWSSWAVEVRSSLVELPLGHHMDVVLMDYKYNSSLTALDVATSVRQAFPGVPIAILSDVYSMPMDMRPFAAAFVRKGEPEELVKKLQELLGSRAS